MPSAHYYCVALLFTLFGGLGTAIPLDDFYPFGTALNDFSLPPNDDGSSEAILLNRPFPFFGSRHTSLFVNNNGLLSFDARVGQFTPQSFPLGDGRMIIAPYWGDVDTRGIGTVWYRETSTTSLLDRAKRDIQSAFVNQRFFEPTTLFIATWDHVGYYSSHTDLTNTFQCVLTTNGRRSFAIFLYADGGIQWTTGDASGGNGGFGGTPAQVGFNAGDGERFANITSSQTPDVVNVDSTTNVDIPGVWIFRVDEEEIDTRECNNDPSVRLTVGPRFGNIFGGTAVHLTGPCFDDTDVLKCVFEGKSDINAFVANDRTAICISPRFDEIGWKSLTLTILKNGVETYTGQGRFYAALPEDTSDITVDQETLVILQNSEEQFTAHWDPQSLLPMVDPSLFTVDLKLYRLVNDGKDWIPFLKITSGHPNSGIINFTMLSSNQIGLNLYPVALRISVGEALPTGAQEMASQVSAIIRSAQDRVSQWFSSFFYYAIDSLDFADECNAWYRSVDEPHDIGEMLLSRVPDCCQTENRAAAPNSGFVRDTHEALVAFFHPGAASCYRQATISSENMESGQQCCYDSNGNLIIGPRSGGTVDRVAPVGNFGLNVIRHFVVDVLPAIYCCKGNQRDVTCQLYYERRPSGRGESCEPPQPAFTFGDPHIVTLDDLKYTFNGFGEYVLIETQDDSFTLQGRMIQARDTDGDLISATAYSTIVAKQSDSDTVQFQVVDSEIIVDDIDALVNGELLDFEGLSNQQFNNVTLHKMGNTISAIFSSGVHIEVKVENGIVSVLSATLPRIYKSKTAGLMGNYNGDPSDDLVPRYKEELISSSSNVEEIHRRFGVTWIINSTEESLFTYNEDESWSTFYQPDFIPFFEPTFSSSVLEQQANAICGNDIFCQYDIAATGRTDIGQATLESNMELERIINISLPVLCDPPCENGVCVSNDTCSCSEGYTGDICDEFVASECVENLCENGGTCIHIATVSVCSCPDQFSGLLCNKTTTVPSTTLPPTTVPATTVPLPQPPPPLGVQGLCSIVVWYSPAVQSCEDIRGYEVILYNPQSLHPNMTNHVGANRTFYIVEEEKLPNGHETYLQVRVIHQTGRVGEWSEGISLGCEKPTVPEKPPRVYFELKGEMYLNNSALPLTDIGEGNSALYCRTDKEECCGTRPNRFGQFYYPNGAQVLIEGRQQGFYRNRGNQIIRLNRREGIMSPTGTYRCEIPNADDETVKIYITLTE